MRPSLGPQCHQMPIDILPLHGCFYDKVNILFNATDIGDLFVLYLHMLYFFNLKHQNGKVGPFLSLMVKFRLRTLSMSPIFH